MIEIIKDERGKAKKRYYVRVGTATYGPYDFAFAEAFYADMTRPCQGVGRKA